MYKFKKSILSILIILTCFFNTINISQVDASSLPTIKFDDSGQVSGTITKLPDRVTTLNNLLSEYRTMITFLSGIGSLTMIAFFIMNFIALGNSKGNPQERQKAVTGLIVSGIATAGLGSITLISTLFYNMLNL